MVLQTIIGVSKFATLFVAPGVINFLEAGIKLAETASKINDLIDKLANSQELIVEAYANPIMREKMVKSAKEAIMKAKYNMLSAKTLTEEEVEKLVRSHMHR